MVSRYYGTRYYTVAVIISYNDPQRNENRGCFFIASYGQLNEPDCSTRLTLKNKQNHKHDLKKEKKHMTKAPVVDDVFTSCT